MTRGGRRTKNRFGTVGRTTWSDRYRPVSGVASVKVSVAKAESPGSPGLVGKAGERIRTVDIHVGNVTLYH